MSSKKYDFTGKVVLITGSSSGIGAACALQFAKCKAKVVITGYAQQEVTETVDRIEKLTGERPFNLTGNLAEDGFAEKLVQGTVSRYGRLDVLVNNAGTCALGDSFLDPDFMQKYDKVMDLNVRTQCKLIHLCWPYLEKSKGNIINTSSSAAFCPNGWALYCTSKAAVNMLTKCAAVELGAKGIRVNSVCPGPTKTNFANPVGVNLNKEEECPFSQDTILKRNAEPDEIANLMLFLASQEASYITGGNHIVDGGYLCH